MQEGRGLLVAILLVAILLVALLDGVLVVVVPLLECFSLVVLLSGRLLEGFSL